MKKIILLLLIIIVCFVGYIIFINIYNSNSHIEIENTSYDLNDQTASYKAFKQEVINSLEVMLRRSV